MSVNREVELEPNNHSITQTEKLPPPLGAADTDWDRVAESIKEVRRGKSGDGSRVCVLFLCTHNSARSQMAEALMRHYGGGRVDVESAGTELSRVHPNAISAMRELGVKIEGQRSKHLSEFLNSRFDYVITVCDSAKESCPIFPGEPVKIHWSLRDPSAHEDEEERARAFRATALELTGRIRYLLALFDA